MLSIISPQNQTGLDCKVIEVEIEKTERETCVVYIVL